MNIKAFYATLALSAMACLSLASCSSDGEGGKRDMTRHERKEISLDPATRSTAKDLRDFYINFTNDMARYVDSNESLDSKNVVVSPLSASMTLGMIANGVNGNAREDILKYLGTDNLQSLNHLCAVLLSELPKSDNLTDLRLANSVWVNHPYTLNKDFQSLMTGNFDAEARHEDFAANPGKTTNAINDWCARNTNSLIANFIDEVDPSMYALFLNALYFKSPWDDDPFLVENTSTATFHGMKGDSTVDMMKSCGTDGYCQADDNFEFFCLPFGNSSFEVYFVVPDQSLSMEEASALLTPEWFISMKRESVLCPLTVYLPKFGVEGKYRLNDALKASGLEHLVGTVEMTMFEDKVNGVIELNQANSFRVDETGATAAAVTDGELYDTINVAPGQPFTVRVDRPFFFFIEEFSTGACVMSGRITDL